MTVENNISLKYVVFVNFTICLEYYKIITITKPAIIILIYCQDTLETVE